MKDIVALFLMLIVGLGTGCSIGSSQVDSEESAQHEALGVWTNSEPLNSLVQMMVGWNKFIFYENGTFEHYRASPTDSDWGNPQKGNWKVFSSKYINTGEKYYGIAWDKFRPLIYVDANTLQFTDTDGSVLATLIKGDNFPFSE